MDLNLTPMWAQNQKSTGAPAPAPSSTTHQGRGNNNNNNDGSSQHRNNNSNKNTSGGNNFSSSNNNANNVAPPKMPLEPPAQAQGTRFHAFLATEQPSQRTHVPASSGSSFQGNAPRRGNEGTFEAGRFTMQDGGKPGATFHSGHAAAVGEMPKIQYTKDELLKLAVQSGFPTSLITLPETEREGILTQEWRTPAFLEPFDAEEVYNTWYEAINAEGKIRGGPKNDRGLQSGTNAVPVAFAEEGGRPDWRGLCFFFWFG